MKLYDVHSKSWQIRTYQSKNLLINMLTFDLATHAKQDIYYYGDHLCLFMQDNDTATSWCQEQI